MTHKSIIERAAESLMTQPKPQPPLSQGEREYLECIAELRRRLEAAGKQ